MYRCAVVSFRLASISNRSKKQKSGFRQVVLARSWRWSSGMTNSTPSIQDGSLVVRGRPVLTDVPSNVTFRPAAAGSAFLGAYAAQPSSRHVFTLGLLQGYRLLCLFRFKIWWMIPRTGNSGANVPMETQLLLLEVREDAAVDVEVTDSSVSENSFYILLLPVLEGDFRTSLQGNSRNELQFCIESGDAAVQTSQAFEAVFVNSSDNPFELMRESIKIVAKRKGTFSHVGSKKIPANLDWFGWCTWDAFYTQVNPKGIMEGLQSLLEGGTPARFLIIDDGWQDTFNEYSKEGEPLIEGTQFATRLVDIKENHKFKYGGSEGVCSDLGEFIKVIKDRYGLKYVYMWHALAGYWGGVQPTSEEMKKYNPKIEYPIQSPGNTGNLRDIAMDNLEAHGVGLIDPAKINEFYNDMHSYLSRQGVDGVKVDVQNLIETLGSGYGGRVALTRKYQQALEESIAANFADNNVICCMSHNTDCIFSSKKSAVARASEDFMPREPTLQTLHVASVSFNSLLLGEIVVPDWDVFYSEHATAKFHSAARAVGGCAVYVSDKPGHHDFEILKKLVLPDGSILRAKYAGRPSRDSLFTDPVMDGKSLLKIWNLNKFTGVIGVFNCQGAGHWPLQEEIATVTNPSTLLGHVSPSNVEFLDELAGECWTGDCAVFAFNSGCLSRLSKKGTVDVSLSTLQCEIYTVSPIKKYYQQVQFAPLGLINMYNSGGAMEDLKGETNVSGCTIKIKSRGPGTFGAYSNIRPKLCLAAGKEVEFSYDPRNGFLTFDLSDAVSDESSLRDIQVEW